MFTVPHTSPPNTPIQWNTGIIQRALSQRVHQQVYIFVYLDDAVWVTENSKMDFSIIELPWYSERASLKQASVVVMEHIMDLSHCFVPFHG